MGKVQALTALLEALGRLIETVGPGYFVFLLLILTGVAIGYKVYADRRKDRERREALEEKERTIQRLAVEAKEWKVSS